MSKFWLAVACAQHVRRGRAQGFMQVNHGKRGPLERIRPGDGIVYYSPSLEMGRKDGFQSFTAIGYVNPGEPYRGHMADDFQPFRRDVNWLLAEEQPIRPLLDWLDFTQGPNWGYALRLGLIEIPMVDFEFLVHVMTVAVSEKCAALFG
ncbi:MAG TPA: EVE domain-containing protein [Asticcacaulis sp.]|nr:EVE domain-containing protein [Asticcacaulis sp.]